jgi:cytolysin (calcineurin-like family phosphatase)
MINTVYATTTFFVATDAHYGNALWCENEVGNKEAIYDMNQLPYKPYPEELGGLVGKPKAVIITGDLTDGGTYWQWNGLSIFRFAHWDGFISDYGLNGENLLNFPVLEGFGNHDVLSWWNDIPNEVKKRNLLRSEPIKISENGLHYSWNWEEVHYIQLNVYPGETPEAKYSLQFLQKDLQELPNPKMPIVIFHHYGMDGYSDDWWTSEERQKYYDAIKDYNILAIFQGHQHDMFHLVWRGIDVFSSGNTFSNVYLVCTITPVRMKIAARQNGKWCDWHYTKKLNK